MTRLLFAVAIMATSTMAASASTYNLTAFVQRYHSDGGIEHYDAFIHLSLGISGLDNWNRVEVAFISPTGIRYEKRLPISLSLRADFEDIDPSSVIDLLTGKWTIEEIHETRGLRLYEFTIPPIQNSPLFPAEPHILSPQDGAVVGPTFEVVTDRTDGFGARYTGLFTPRNARPIVEPAIGRAMFSFAHVPGFSGGTLELRASSQDFFAELPPTPLTPGPHVIFNDHLVFTTYSPPITLTIAVPEPQALALAAAGFALLVPLSRRKLSKALIKTP